MPISKIIIVGLDDSVTTFLGEHYPNLRGGITSIGFEISYGENFSMFIHPATVKSISVLYKRD